MTQSGGLGKVVQEAALAVERQVGVWEYTDVGIAT
jgi:uncharacterized membrane protein